jgi:hypothetical protein
MELYALEEGKSGDLANPGQMNAHAKTLFKEDLVQAMEEARAEIRASAGMRDYIPTHLS